MNDTRQKIALLFLLLSLPQTAVFSMFDAEQRPTKVDHKRVADKIQTNEFQPYIKQVWLVLKEKYRNVQDPVMAKVAPVYMIGVIDLAYGSISNFMRSKIAVQKMNQMYDWHKPELYDVEKIHAGLDALNRLPITNDKYFQLNVSYYGGNSDILQSYVQDLSKIYTHVPNDILKVYVIEVLKYQKSGQPGFFKKHKVWTSKDVADYNPQWPDTVNSDGDYVGDPTTVQKIYACMQGIQSIYTNHTEDVTRAGHALRKFMKESKEPQKKVIPTSADVDNSGTGKMPSSRVAGAGGGSSDGSSSQSPSSSSSSSSSGLKLQPKKAAEKIGEEVAPRRMLYDGLSKFTYENLQAAEADLTEDFLFTQSLANKPSSITERKNGQSEEERQFLMVEQAKSVYPLLDGKVNKLIQDFLDVKREHGSRVEKTLYANMTARAFIRRLLTKRPYTFWNQTDDYLLRDRITQSSGRFETIGKYNQGGKLVLADYLSYDEMAISALVSVAVPTFFVNSGNRHNNGRQGAKGSYENQGVLVGAVGARFEKPGLMEYAHMIITPEQNTPANGYGDPSVQGYVENPLLQVWAKFYGIDYFPSWDEVKVSGLIESENEEDDPKKTYLMVNTYEGSFDDDSFKEITFYIHKDVYKKRMKSVVAPYLFAANQYAQDQGKKAYCRVVGLGLGVWAKHVKQQKWLVDVYLDALHYVDLKNISRVEFYSFGLDEEYTRKQKSSVKNIAISFTRYQNGVNPFMPVAENQLLVAQYAWDGNSYPGNEYWVENLAASDDPAAACASSITYLQNPDVNPDFTTRIGLCYFSGPNDIDPTGHLSRQGITVHPLMDSRNEK